MNKSTILVIDDEPQTRKQLEIILESNEYKVVQAASSGLGIKLAANHRPELILLDIDLPDKDGHQTLAELRTWYSNAIIILSVMNSEEDIVKAFDNGATDYLTKPFRTTELLARIRNAIGRNKPIVQSSILVFGNIEIDMASRIVKKNGEPVKLTSTEYSLLILFAKNEGRVLTQQFVLKEIWGDGSQAEAQYLRVFVGSLRKKIEDEPSNPQHIITENGIGYRFR
ncbi:MAG: response regulator transcription factor [Chitinophagaceae bacterium]|jgi:two-component system KDP operon response regulator KdpE|nr:response regulator transcription factor [Chitinophagaceae bacterium]